MRRVAAGQGAGRDRPLVAGPAARARGAAMRQQARVAQALQVRAHPVGMQFQALRKLVGRRRAAMVREQREQSPSCRLGEEVVPVEGREVDAGHFSHREWEKAAACMVRCSRRSVESRMR